MSSEQYSVEEDHGEGLKVEQEDEEGERMWGVVRGNCRDSRQDQQLDGLKRMTY